MPGLSPVSPPYEPVTRININVFKSKKTSSRNSHNFKKHLNLLTVFHAFPSFTFRLCMFQSAYHSGPALTQVRVCSAIVTPAVCSSSGRDVMFLSIRFTWPIPFTHDRKLHSLQSQHRLSSSVLFTWEHLAMLKFYSKKMTSWGKLTGCSFKRTCSYPYKMTR